MGKATLTVIAALVLGALVLVGSTQGQERSIRIIQLDCDSNPEVVMIQNLGEGTLNLSGWQLQSDPVTFTQQVFDLSVVVSLSPGDQASIFSGSNAPFTDAGAGEYRWARNFKFRNEDPTDFAQIVDERSILIDQVNCGEAPGGLLGDVNCSRSVNSIDAALVLQLDAGLIGSLACQGDADVNQDDLVNAIDAALILQFDAGLISHLPN